MDYLGPASASSHRKCSFGIQALFPRDLTTTMPWPGQVFSVDRTGSHSACRLPPLPPREQRFRPARRGAAQPVLPGPQIPLAPARDGDSPRPAGSPRPSVCWAGFVPILSRQSRAAVRGRDASPRPRPHGEAGQVEGPRSPRQARPRRPEVDRPPGAALAHSGGHRNTTTPYPRVARQLASRLTRQPQPAAWDGTRASSAACARPAPGEEPAGSRPLSRSCCGLQATRSSRLSSLAVPAHSAVFLSRTLPAASPCPPSRVGTTRWAPRPWDRFRHT